MFKGLHIAKKSFERDQVYLLNHIVNNVGSIVFGYINVRIWLAVLGNTQEGMNAVTYLMVNQAALWLVMFLPYGCYIPKKVYDGSIAYEMLRPYSIMYGSFFEIIGHTAYNFLFRSIPIFLFGVLVLGVNLPDINQVLPFLITLINGVIIDYELKHGCSSKFNQKMFGRISTKKTNNGVKAYYIPGVLHNIPHHKIYSGKIFIGNHSIYVKIKLKLTK